LTGTPVIDDSAITTTLTSDYERKKNVFNEVFDLDQYGMNKQARHLDGQKLCCVEN
jgi:hypothetical protein